MEPVELRPLKSIWIWSKDHHMERKRPDFVSEDSWGSRGREFKSRHSDQVRRNSRWLFLLTLSGFDHLNSRPLL